MNNEKVTPWYFYKTAFSFDNFYMGSVMMYRWDQYFLSEFKNMTLKPLIETSVLKVYCRYVDDTLVKIKQDKIQHVLNSFHSFDKD